MWTTDEIASMCYTHYSTKLPKKGLPDPGREWTLLAAVVKVEEKASVQSNDEFLEVVAMGTGSKCIGQTQMSKNAMPQGRKMKKTNTGKTTQVGTRTRPMSTKEPRSQVHYTTGDTEQETAATLAIPKGKGHRELRKREGWSMRKREQQKLQSPATTATESDSESEGESEIPERSDEEGDKSPSRNIEKTLRQIMRKLDTLKVIKNNQKILEEKMTKMEIMLDKMTKRQEKMEKRITDLETTTEDMVERMDKIENENTAWTSERKQFMGKIDKLENFSRRNNIKIVGLKEDIEGEDPINFFQKWIPEKLEMEGETPIEIERAHRSLRSRPRADQNPRSILIKCLRYQDKEKILKAAAQSAKNRNGPLMIAGKPVLFYPDISYNLLKRKKEFNPVKKALWEKGYKFTMHHPATLIIFLEEGKFFFPDYRKAEEFVQELPSIR
ncbi:tRNA-specific adenosine deaminase 1 isoform X3 [Hemitrygon akajei]|uniref:tRNA-specific adenosine deaminase 1 isoform X3 n=1 Tax=Hemitrygon akajei TaxID=2704970 RepID=UPI003BF9A7EA